MTTRNEIELRTVATLAKLVGTKAGRKTALIHRARYNREMAKIGCDGLAYQGWADCWDMAVLEVATA